MPDNQTKQFLNELRAIAKELGHEKTAGILSIKVWQLRNWLYRDVPSPLAVRALAKTVSKRYDQLRDK